MADLSALHEPIGEAIGVALDRVLIVLVREYGAFRIQHEARRHYLLADGRGVHPMQRLGVARPRPCGGRVVDDDVAPTGRQPLADGSIEVGRRRALLLNQRCVEIVVEQVQPQDICGLRGLLHRDEVRRDGFDVLSARLLRERPHAADRVVIEMGDFGRHEAVDPTLGSHDVGELARPVAVAWVDVDDSGARIYTCEPDQLGLLGLVVHRDLH